jgi:hypothetical protein
VLAAIHAAGPFGAVEPSRCSRHDSALGTALARLAGGTNEERRIVDLLTGMRGVKVTVPPSLTRFGHGFTDIDARREVP